MCPFLGGKSDSPAAKGRRADPGGYISNAEINEVIMGDLTLGSGARPGQVAVKSWHDSAPNSNIVVYNGDEWVGCVHDARDKRNAPRALEEPHACGHHRLGHGPAGLQRG